MKRFLVFLGTSLFGLALTGCASDPRGDAVSGVVGLMETAATEVGTITSEVNKAVKKQKDENVAFDLNDAIKATKKLEERGKAVQKIKTEQVDRLKVATDDEKVALAEKFKIPLNNAFANLVKAKAELNQALTKAEELGADAKEKVDDLRTKIREAEGPFDALNRQQG
jgi:hypothetical protein